MPTVKAAFGGRVPLVDFDEGTAIPCCFIFQLANKLTPSHITYSFSQTMVCDHVLDAKTLKTDRLVLTNYLRREFVLIVTPPISNFCVKTSHFHTLLATVLGAFFLLRQATLCLRQFLFVFGEKLGVPMGMSIGGDDHGFQAQIEPNLLGHCRQSFDLFFNQDGDEVAIGSVLAYRHRGGFTSLRQGSGPVDIQRSIHLGESEGLAILPEGGCHIACGAWF